MDQAVDQNLGHEGVDQTASVNAEQPQTLDELPAEEALPELTGEELVQDPEALLPLLEQQALWKPAGNNGTSSEQGGQLHKPAALVLNQAPTLQQRNDAGSATVQTAGVSEALVQYPQAVNLAEQLSANPLHPAENKNLLVQSLQHSAQEMVAQGSESGELPQILPQATGEQLAESDFSDAFLLQRLMSGTEARAMNPSQMMDASVIQTAAVSTQSSSAPALATRADGTANTQALASPQETPLGMLHDPDWADDLGQRVYRMATDENGLREAKLRLDPPSLGTLDIQLRIDDNKLSVQFHSASPQVREMIMQHVERLRDSMNGTDMTLVDVDVSSGNSSGNEAGHEQHNNDGVIPGSHSSLLADDTATDSDFLLQEESLTPAPVFAGRTLISTYA